MSGDAAECTRIFVVDNAVHVDVAIGSVHLRHRNAIEEWMIRPECGGASAVGRQRSRRQRIESGVMHLEGLPDARRQELIEWHAGDALDDQSGEDKIPIAVDDAVAGIVDQWPGIDLREIISASAVLAPERGESLEASAMGEDHAHRYACLRRVVELRQVTVHGRVEIESTLVLEHHRGGGGGDDFGERRQVEHRRVGDRRGAAGDVDTSIALQVDESAIASHCQCDAGCGAF